MSDSDTDDDTREQQQPQRSPDIFANNDDSTTDDEISIIEGSWGPSIPEQINVSSDGFGTGFTSSFEGRVPSFNIVDEYDESSNELDSSPSDQETPFATNSETNENQGSNSSSLTNTGDVSESPSGNRKRTADPRGPTSARKVSRLTIGETSQIPTTSRSVLPIVPISTDNLRTPAASASKAESDNDDAEDNINCSICMEPYTNSGPHRISCLKCGHIYGHSCIQRWLAGQKSCPLCNAKATMSDVRLLFTKNLIALDSAELQRTKNELEKVKISKERLNFELNRVKLTLELKEKELQAMKRQQPSNSGASNTDYVETGTTETFDGESNLFARFIASVAYEKDAGFRVGAYSEQSGMLVVSQTIGNPLYPSGAFGIRIIKMYDAKFSYQKSVLHQKQIRDLCFAKYTDNTVLTCGMDKKAILSNIEQKVVIHSFNASETLWSCVWDAINVNIFYVGTGNGKIMSYDVRSPKEIHNLFDAPLDNSPVARMVFTDREADYTGQGRRHNGLVIQHLNSVWYGQVNNNTCEEYEKLPLEGAFTNMDYDPKTHLMLLTTRSAKSPKEIVNVQNVYQLSRRPSSSDSLVSLEPIRTAELVRKNQIFMTRSKIWSPYEDTAVPSIVATDWSEKEECVWLPTTSKMSYYGKCSGDIVVDYVPANRGDKPYIVSITTDKIRLLSLERAKVK